MKLTDQLTQDFKLSEFFITSQAGGQAGLWADFMALPEAKRKAYYSNILQVAKYLQCLRSLIGKPINITSGWRSPRVNELVGGVSDSRHLTGQAADFNIAGMTPKEVQRILDPWWFGGLGYGDTFTHTDIRPTKTRFNY